MVTLPENKRREVGEITKRVMWIYGAPFSGKTTFADSAPNPLMLNTDGNAVYVTAPYVSIQDEVIVNGRMTQRKMAWVVFKEYVEELEKGQNDFKTIVVDLVNDAYEMCRLYMYDQMGITHESDDSFRAWDKVRTEFLSTLKRLMNLDYENIILISHEDTSKDITKRGGDKITAIKPNLQEKAANKVAGMVDMVARIIADDNKRILSFKSDEVVFGGGRLSTSVNEIDLDYDTFLEVYEEANKSAVANLKTQEKTQEKVEEKTTEEDAEEKTKRTTRKRQAKEEMTTDEMIENLPFAPDEEEKAEEPKEEKKEEAPKATRTRKRRGE